MVQGPTAPPHLHSQSSRVHRNMKRTLTSCVALVLLPSASAFFSPRAYATRSMLATRYAGAEEGSYTSNSVETDFCLAPQDSSVSGDSVTKTLNQLSNRVAREVLVRRPSLGGLGEVVEVEPLATQISALRQAFVDQFNVASEGDATTGTSTAEVYADAVAYFDAVAAVALLPVPSLESGVATPAVASEAAPTSVSVAPSSLGTYAGAYQRFRAVLDSFGYDEARAASDPPSLNDRNFCLSMLDQLQPVGFPPPKARATAAEAAAATAATAAAAAAATAAATAAAEAKAQVEVEEPPTPADSSVAVETEVEPAAETLVTSAASSSSGVNTPPWEQLARGFETAWKQLFDSGSSSTDSRSNGASKKESSSGSGQESTTGGESVNVPPAVVEEPVPPPFFAGIDLESSSATATLNCLANRVLRCVLYGNDVDKASLAAAWPVGAIAFKERYGKAPKTSGGRRGGKSESDSSELIVGESEAEKFYAALGDLLGPAGLRAGTASATSERGLKDTYADGLRRVTATLVESMGQPELGRGTRKDLQALSDFALWERDIRLNMTSTLWDAYPTDLVGSWQLVETDSASLLVNPNELAEFNYASGGGTSRTRRPPPSLLAPLNTALAQASGTTSSPRGQRNAPAKAAVTLLEGGGVTLAARDCEGIGWRLDPGPTHLDTCYITVAAPRGTLGGSAVRDFLGSDRGNRGANSGSSSGGGSDGAPEKEILTFMGYVDRGQRIEARFSKRPVRMSGLVSAADVQAQADVSMPVASSTKGSAASRFVMEKDRV